ncbi:hypothetical protein P168DRAFT_323935 [Aspergillus campestris IBT 28561]|uniref:Methyltransferase n=1 Tax=Aspergillus campestris (strain IBT 28561) TaxID=1392248 RepID=A0A2I1DG82_ASPC2|nr:uncharacterized protein P168DRAFT_323935 [Aspergillus campestris IBT 28561]PKY08885.1 hypothetical protein P168DRAFT_323935 [Aspergillus campestris IBT 28561]
MTTASFKHIDPKSYDPHATAPFHKPWSKVDGPGSSFNLISLPRHVTNLRDQTTTTDFTINTAGFSLHHAPSTEKTFTDESTIRTAYYAEVDTLLRTIHPAIKKVVPFDHTIRRRVAGSPRSPVEMLHVDQTPAAAAARVRRHLPADEADAVLNNTDTNNKQKRYQIINVWRPIENPATDYPLSVIDWRTTTPQDFVPVDLLYPESTQSETDSTGKEVPPEPGSATSTAGYAVRGEIYVVAPSEAHRFYYVSDMVPEEVAIADPLTHD